MLATFAGVAIVLTAVVAPTPCSAVIAVGYGAVVELMTATRVPVAEAESETVLPDSTSNALAASATVRVIGPAASCDLATGSTPSVETAPTVGFRPTTPATPAGPISCAVSVEVSVPIVSAARPAAVAAARARGGAGRRLVGVGRRAAPGRRASE